LARPCPQCQAEIRPGVWVCDACGHLLKSPTVPAQPAAGPVTPARLAEKMRRQRPAEGERRTVTVLFADARARSKKADPGLRSLRLLADDHRR
jgi:hypothetical protein